MPQLGLEEQRQQSAELQEQRRQQLERSIRQGQNEVRRIIRRLRQGGAASGGNSASLGETARQAGQRLKHLERQHQSAPQRRDHGGWMPAPGQRVRVLSLGKAGEVLALAEDRRDLSVRCGVMRLTVPLEGIEGLNGETPSPPETAVEGKLRAASGPVWVIHGISTGKLRRGLRDLLATVPWLERVSDAGQGDGGAGCSVVWVR